MTQLEQAALVRRIEILEAQSRAVQASVTAITPSSTSTTTTAAAAFKINWITPTVIDSGNYVTSPAWTTFDASAIVGSAATSAMIEFDWAMNDPDGVPTDPTLTAHTYVRPDSSGSIYEIAAGRSAGNSDQIAGFSQAFVQISAALSFDYEVDSPGYGNGWELRIVGWI